MKIELEQLPESRAKMAIQFGTDQTSKAYSNALKEASKSVQVPGFRPGQVPKDMIEKQVGIERLQAHALELVLTEHLNKIIAEKGLDLISRPELQDYLFVQDGLKVTVALELRPSVKLGNYKGLVLTIPKPKLPELTSDKLLEKLARDLAPWEEQDASSAVAAREDKLILDFKGRLKATSEPVPDSSAEDMEAVLNEETFPTNVIEQMLGKSCNEDFEVSTTFPADHNLAELAGQEAIFAVHIKQIARKSALPIDDELATKTGRKDLADLNQALAGEITKTVNAVEDLRLRAFALDQFLQETSIEIPLWLKERDANRLKEIAEQQEGEEEHVHGENCNHDHDHEDEKPEIILTEEDLALSERRLHLQLALTEIAKEEKISVNQQELQGAVAAYMRATELPKENVTQELVSFLAEDLVLRKAIALLGIEAKPTFVEEDETNLKVLQEKIESLRQICPYF